MASRLDDLARSLATPVSRRRALRLTAAAALGSMLATRTTPAPAARQPLDGCPTCPRGNDPPEYSQFCGFARGVGCLFVCCPPTYACCQANAGVVCCREGYECGPIVNDLPSCRCKNDCGGACCKDGEQCVDAVAGRCCAVPCGKECCQAGEKCADPKRGVCCKSSERACIGKNQTTCCDANLEKCCAGSRVTQCCGYGETCDQDVGGCKCRAGFPKPCVDDCCRRTDRCCHGPSGRGFCAPQGWKCCGDTVALDFEECCVGRFPFNPRFQRCCGVSGVCPRTAECCPDGCCPAGSSCCAHGCCAFDGTPLGRAQPFDRIPDRRAQAVRRGPRVARGARPPVP